MIVRTIRAIFADRRGASVVEFAFAMPVAAALMLGILQFGIVLQATGAIRHAVGEGVRYANLHPDASEKTVSDEVREAMAGLDVDSIVDIDLDRGVLNGAQYDKVSIRYRLEPVIPMLRIGPIELEDSALSYVQS